VPTERIEAALPDLARQAFGSRNDRDSVLFARTPETLAHEGSGSTDMLPSWLHQVTRRVQPGGVLAVETRDVRTDGTLHPMGLEVCRALRQIRGLRLKEIIAVVPPEETGTRSQAADQLAITHRYLLVATRDRSA
jgi:hypothetical protein